LGDRLIARVDVKSDRDASALLVHAAATEPGVKPAAVVGPLAGELRALARWLALDRVVVGTRGNLAGPLRRML
ncbi:MAG TPA: winged helix-turn-helix domain-containing protein, partial [Polyangiaceae bacterium]